MKHAENELQHLYESMAYTIRNYRLNVNLRMPIKTIIDDTACITASTFAPNLQD